jgi:hypothetical protein
MNLLLHKQRMDFIVIISLLVAIGYLFIYFRGRYYNYDNFEDQSKSYTVLDTSYKTKPFVTNEDKYGDFEQDFVFQNEGGYDPTREAINMARRRLPFEWSQLPPSSSLFQAQQALFVKEDTSAMAAPFTKETFETIEARKVLPPDSKEAEQAELDALKMYKPIATADMKSVDEKSVKELVNQIYGDKGLIAKVAKKANNVYEVYEVQEKNPKIVYEDEVTEQQASIQDNALYPIVNPSEMLVVPNAVSELEAGLTPYGKGESVGLQRQEYSDYNPNLEGIFGPKMQWQQWG